MANSVSPYQDAMGRFETFKRQPERGEARALSLSLESVYARLLSSAEGYVEQARALAQAMEFVQAYLRADSSMNRRVERLPVESTQVSGNFRFASYDTEAFLSLAVKVLNAIRSNRKILSGGDLDDLAAEVVQEMEEGPDGEEESAKFAELLGADSRWMIYPSMKTQILFNELAAAPVNAVICQISDQMRPEAREDPVALFGVAYVQDAELPYSLFFLEKGAPRLVSAASAEAIQKILEEAAPEHRYIQVDLLKDSVFGITY